MKTVTFISILASFSLCSPTHAQPSPASRPALDFADVADLATAAPIIAKGRITGIKGVKPDRVNAADPTRKYKLVTVRVDSLIRGQGGIAPRVSFLMLEHALRLRGGARVLVFAWPGKQQTQIQLVSMNALQPWSAELETTTRAITTEVLSAHPAPAILAVGDAFHVPGTVEGESETQIFLKTATGEPVSLSVVHRSGQTARWGVSLGEIVDDTAAPPSPGTLLWYRLACSLPETLPLIATRSLSVLHAEAARRDYRFVMESLGSCGRTL